MAPIASYEAALRQLLSAYLNEERCEAHYRALQTSKQRLWEDEVEYGQRTSQMDYDLGRILPAGELKALLLAGVPDYVQLGARNAPQRKSNFNRMVHH